MKNQKLYKKIAAILILGFSVPLSLQAQQSEYEFLRGPLTTAKDFTVEVFNAMPSEDYSFKPTEDVRTFAAQAYHIAYSLEWFSNQLKGTPIQWAPGDEDAMNKEELVKYVSEQFDALTEIIMSAEEDGQFTAGVLGVLRHNSHHRGQMVTYLRTNGIQPPAYK
ncbi:MAG: DinB family protein [Balneola sp.]